MNDRPFNYALLVRTLVCGICYRPEDVTIKEVRSHDGSAFYVIVHVDDMGLVIGAAGKVIKAIQKILRTISARENKFVQLFVDKKGESITRAALYKSKDSWDKTDEVIGLVNTILAGAGYTMGCTAEECFDNTVITCKTDAPEELLEAMQVALHSWGKSQGRRILITTPEMVKAV